MRVFSSNFSAPIVTTGGALLLLAACARAFLSRNMPSVTCPLPVPLVLLSFIGLPRLVVVALPSMVFCAWCRLAFSGQLVPWKRSMIMFVLVLIGSVVAFCYGWRYGVEFQGYAYTLSVALISAGLAVAAAALLRTSRLTSSVAVRVVANLLLFVWAFTYAFPYLGELP